MAVGISGGTADGLDEGCLGPQEALLVGVDNGNEGNLGYVQAFAKKVDADEYIEDVQPHVADDLGPLQGIYIGMEIFDTDPRLGQVVCEVLRHFLGQCGDKHLVFFVRLPADLTDQVVDLALDGADLDLRVKKAGRPDDLFGPKQLVFLLIGTGGRGDKEHLVDMGLKFRKFQRPVIQSGRKPEAVADQSLLAGAVAAVHGPDLWDCHMRLIDDDEKVIVKEIHEGHGRFALLHEIQVAGIVFDTGAEAGLPHHFNVKIGAFRNALGFQEHIFSLEVFHPLAQLLLNVVTGCIDLFLWDNIVGGRVDHHMLQLSVDAAGQLIHFADAVDLIAEPLNPENVITALGREDLQRVAADPEIAALEGHIIAGILDRHKFMQDLIPVLFHAGSE